MNKDIKTLKKKEKNRMEKLSQVNINQNKATEVILNQKNQF